MRSSVPSAEKPHGVVVGFMSPPFTREFPMAITVCAKGGPVLSRQLKVLLLLMKNLLLHPVVFSEALLLDL